jgi:transcriptional regulator with XRE-family HTH domain
MLMTEIGEKIKQLRIRTNLTQEELASRCDLSKGFISQMERGLTSPSIATLEDILECLGTNPAEFFREPDHGKIRFRQEDAYTTEDEELGNTITWIVPNAQKNDMEPILVDLRPKGCTAEYGPHPGEVFGYVLLGSLDLYIGEKKWNVKKGECFYFEASDPYRIENRSLREASFIWVSSPPSF